MTHPTLKYSTWFILIDGEVERDYSDHPCPFRSEAAAKMFHGHNPPAEFVEYEVVAKPRVRKARKAKVKP